MPRGLVIFLVVAGLVAVLGFWGLPWLRKNLLGDTRQTRYLVTMAVDDYECSDSRGRTVSRTVVGLEIYFPMGGAPENTGEFIVVDDEGRPVQVEWSRPEREDQPDQGITRWLFKEVFFPIGFRRGAVRTKYRELFYLSLPPVPYNAP